MAFIPKDNIEVGDMVKLTRVVSVFAGKFEKGTLVKVTHICRRGYSIVDKYGNAAIEIGYCVKATDAVW